MCKQAGGQTGIIIKALWQSNPALYSVDENVKYMGDKYTVYLYYLSLFPVLTFGKEIGACFC